MVHNCWMNIGNSVYSGPRRMEARYKMVRDTSDAQRRHLSAQCSRLQKPQWKKNFFEFAFLEFTFLESWLIPLYKIEHQIVCKLNKDCILIYIFFIKGVSKCNGQIQMALRDRRTNIFQNYGAQWLQVQVLDISVSSICLKKVISAGLNSTDRNILEDSYQLVKHFPEFLFWEYRIASFN